LIQEVRDRAFRIGIILGSTRTNRNGEQVAKWPTTSPRGALTPSTSWWTAQHPLSHLDEPASAA
jgi:hypothetical protein